MRTCKASKEKEKKFLKQIFKTFYGGRGGGVIWKQKLVLQYQIPEKFS